jgi:hypothetical protein
MPEPESDDRPWTEAQWEKLMRESEVRSAKFGELIETLADHPDRDAIIAHEMGWDGPEYNQMDEEEIAALNAAMEEAAREAAESDEELDDPRGLGQLESVEAYTAAYEWALKVHDTLKPLFDLESAKPEEEWDPDDDVSRVLRCFEIAAKIAGGHGIGYEDDEICGNIVNCKKSLAAADESLEALQAIRDRGPVSGETVDQLIAEGKRVRQLVADRIAELRSRVWWD